MTSNTELYKKMAEVVEAVEEVDGVLIDDAAIAERPSEMMDPMALLTGNEPETDEVISLIIEPSESPDIEQSGFDPEPPDDAIGIDIDDAENMETEQ